MLSIIPSQPCRPSLRERCPRVFYPYSEPCTDHRFFTASSRSAISCPGYPVYSCPFLQRQR
jgi:hypothetical protein